MSVIQAHDSIIGSMIALNFNEKLLKQPLEWSSIRKTYPFAKYVLNCIRYNICWNKMRTPYLELGTKNMWTTLFFIQNVGEYCEQCFLVFVKGFQLCICFSYLIVFYMDVIV